MKVKGLVFYLFAPTAWSWSSSRRTFFAKVASFTGASAAALTSAPQVSRAISPLTETELTRQLEKSMRAISPPNKLSRPPLALDFAVLLTRSSYAEASQLNIIPVNQLERDMYMVRTTEYLPYIQRAGTVMQGDLTDPKYFDYMSAVQYVVINRALRDPETDFEELQPQDSEAVAGKLIPVRVHRTLSDQELAPAFDERVGQSILDYLKDTFGKSPIALQFSETTKPDHTVVRQALSQLVNLFLVNGFATSGKVELVKQHNNNNNNNKEGDQSSAFLLSLEAPATLWSSQVLAKQVGAVRNDFCSRLPSSWFDPWDMASKILQCPSRETRNVVY